MRYRKVRFLPLTTRSCSTSTTGCFLVDRSRLWVSAPVVLAAFDAGCAGAADAAAERNVDPETVGRHRQRVRPYFRTSPTRSRRRGVRPAIPVFETTSDELASCLQNAVTKLREEPEAQTPTVPSILKPSPSMGEGWGGGDVRQIAARDLRVSEISSIRKRRNEHEDLSEAKKRLAGIGCPSLRRLCSGTVTPTQTLPHQGGGLLRSRYVTAIERQCTSAQNHSDDSADPPPRFPGESRDPLLPWAPAFAGEAALSEEVFNLLLVRVRSASDSDRCVLT
jgi:hypothetical protein